MLDFRKDRKTPLVTLPFEIERQTVEKGQTVAITDAEGNILGNFPVENVRTKKKYPKTLLVQVRLNTKIARQAAGIRVQKPAIESLEPYEKAAAPDQAVICRCERVFAGDIREHIRNGVRDMNQLKALTRAGMGSCGSKTCRALIKKIFQDEGIDPVDVVDRTDRPLFVEVPMGCFAGMHENKDHDEL